MIQAIIAFIGVNMITDPFSHNADTLKWVYYVISRNGYSINHMKCRKTFLVNQGGFCEGSVPQHNRLALS